MLKNIIAFAIAFILWIVLWLGANNLMSMLFSNRFDAQGTTTNIAILFLLLLMSILIAAISGWVLALVTGESNRTLALTLGAFLFTLALMVHINNWQDFPAWYHILFLILMIPSILFGNRIIERDSLFY